MTTKPYKRSAFTGLSLTFKTMGSVLLALKENRLAMLIPVAVVLFAAAALLYFVNLVSPLAPFVYSLF